MQFFNDYSVGNFDYDPELTSEMLRAGELLEALQERNPEHELLDLLTEIEPDSETVFEAFQTRFGQPNATREERYTRQGQIHFWRQYGNAIARALNEDPVKAEATTNALLMHLMIAKAP